MIYRTPLAVLAGAVTLGGPMTVSESRAEANDGCPAEVASAAPEQTEARLSGIVVAPNHRLAIFAVSDGKAVIRSEGDTLNGWRLDSISTMAVSVSGPGGTRTLEPRPGRDLLKPAQLSLETGPDTTIEASQPTMPTAGGPRTGSAAPLSPLRPLGH
jgi:hypothetical protein